MKNPVDDGKAVAAELRKLDGAKVTELTDTDGVGDMKLITEKIDEWQHEVRRDPVNTVAVFAFFGHGAQGICNSQQHNYLLPQDLFSRVLPEEVGGDQKKLQEKKNYEQKMMKI